MYDICIYIQPHTCMLHVFIYIYIYIYIGYGQEDQRGAAYATAQNVCITWYGKRKEIWVDKWATKMAVADT